MTRPHQLPRAEFDALATGGGGPSSIRHLVTTNHSKHLALLRAVLDSADAQPEAQGPLSHVSVAWELLVEVQRARPDVVDRLLRHPVVGIWVVHALRRLRRTAVDPAPLWVTLGYLHCVAAAAAIHAGLRFALDVPLVDGTVTLPTIGLARIDGERRRWGIATVSGGHGGLRVRGATGTVRVEGDLTADAEGWCATRRLRVPAVDLLLDDLDPFRGFGERLPPARLDGDEVARWQNCLTRTWTLLTEHHAATADALATGLTVLVPRLPSGRFQPYSASAQDAFGCVALSLPSSAVDFAATLVHEFQHSKLCALLDLVELHRDDHSGRRFYAPWRDDPRPFGGLLHGSYSFVGVAGFWRVQRRVDNTPLAHFEFAHWREQTRRATRTLGEASNLTSLGRRFVAAMSEQLSAWCAEPVPADSLSAARLAAADHHATWRLRHLRPDPLHVALLADAWLTSVPRPLHPEPRPTMVPAAEVPDDPTPRMTLTRTMLADPDQFAAIRDDPRIIPGTTDADIALVAGDVSAAARGYLELVRDASDDACAWAGLGRALHAKPAGAALLHRPELVKAVYRKVLRSSGSAPDPIRLAAWIGVT
ncbi:HEXXH motif domain-containing protein [Umezawaea sp. Da 62-37]|uniref:HEXXH motif domain-containing protein n=1 Tax=Umezawaea sp. Da 62-37 TaxID=3075927 RepID=UPI0028F745B3|nr:HEXXH motif domain-containing protein [Umezawaea sp. Da 62-37]WNV88739.1 HEXXH motif domain-containing protein [Umezawaea sp. Da 62-37]